MLPTCVYTKTMQQTDSHIQRLLRHYPLVSEQVDKTELAVILTECAQALAREPRGNVVEFGCYVGTTSLFLRRLMNVLNAPGELHVYDSFAGLPPKTAADASPVGEQFKTGELAASKQQLIRNFKQAGLRLPVIHKGWFDGIEPAAVPGTIAFAFLDGDYYQSITSSLNLVWPKLAQNATVVIDDYQNEALPGARQAVNDLLSRRRATLRVQSSLAILYLS